MISISCGGEGIGGREEHVVPVCAIGRSLARGRPIMPTWACAAAQNAGGRWRSAARKGAFVGAVGDRVGMLQKQAATSDVAHVRVIFETGG